MDANRATTATVVLRKQDVPRERGKHCCGLAGGFLGVVEADMEKITLEEFSRRVRKYLLDNYCDAERVAALLEDEAGKKDIVTYWESTSREPPAPYNDERVWGDWTIRAAEYCAITIAWRFETTAEEIALKAWNCDPSADTTEQDANRKKISLEEFSRLVRKDLLKSYDKERVNNYLAGEEAKGDILRDWWSANREPSPVYGYETTYGWISRQVNYCTTTIAWDI